MGHTHPGYHAGNPRSVHPHIRGAYVIFPRGLVPCHGSSPHTWGIRPMQSGSPSSSRFIPTYVGHTISPVRCARRWTVHPHIRGAYIDRVGGGNSPRRFIPTYVGHTAQDVYPDEAKSVHPHIRGAYTLQVHSRWTYFGSSPHTWGIQGFRRCGRKNGRFIPTYVGHTP